MSSPEAKVKIKAFLLALLLFLPWNGNAQCPQRTTLGSDFWVAFCVNYAYGGLSFIAAAPRDCEVTVSNGSDNSPETYGVVSVAAGQTVQIEVPNYARICHITATDSIALYASNYQPYSWDITMVIPTHALRGHYIVQTYSDNSNSMYNPEFRWVNSASLTNTTMLKRIYDMSVTPSHFVTTTTNYYNTNSGFGHFEDCTDGYSLSGSEVIADKPVALFQGHQCANVPSGYAACDHLYEQALPVDYWGTDYVLVPTAERGYRNIIGMDRDSNTLYSDIVSPGNGDIVQVTSSADNCILWLDGVPMDTLQQFETVVFGISPDLARRLVASRPVTVYIYLGGVGYSGEYGDPAMVLVPPVEQRISEAFFTAISTDITKYHYVNIVTRNSAVEGMRLDNSPIGSAFMQLDSLYSYARIDVAPGTHSISCDSGAFVAHFYGLGQAESYAYIAGMSFNDISHLYIDGAVRQRLPDGVRACVDDTLDFIVTTTVLDSATQWIVDGVAIADSTPLVMRYAFHSPGVHKVAAIVQGRSCDTLRANVYISGSAADTVAASICEGMSYLLGNTYYSTSGTYKALITTAWGCDSSVVVNLSVDTLFDIEVRDTTCANQPYSWHGRQYLEAGVYVDTIASSSGCDTIAHLHLALKPLKSTDYFDTACSNQPYSWHGRQYLEAGVYADTMASSSGCDTVARLHLEHWQLSTSDIFDTACLSEPYSWHGRLLTTAGHYPDTIQVAGDCDSVQILHLFAMPTPDITISQSGNCSYYTLVASTDAPYLRWNSTPGDPALAGHEDDTTVEVRPSEPTTYTVTADYSWEFLCPSSTFVRLAPPEQVVAEMSVTPPSVTTDNLKFTLADLSTNATSRKWFLDYEYVGASPHLTLNANPAVDSHYVMLVAANGSCTDTATSVVKVLTVTLWAPNAFTPDESANNTFSIVGEGIIEGQLYIYTRQGLMVCHKTDYRDGWDGTYHGAPCPKAAYTWHLVYRTIDQPEMWHTATGTVTLLR